MSRGLAFVFALAALAGAANAESDRSAFSRTQTRLTEQLNAVIAARVELAMTRSALRIGAPETRDSALAAREVRTAR